MRYMHTSYHWLVYVKLSYVLTSAYPASAIMDVVQTISNSLQSYLLIDGSYTRQFFTFKILEHGTAAGAYIAYLIG